MQAATARRLAQRAPLPLDARRPFAVKRHEHEIDVGAPAERLAAALRDVLAGPGATFGAIALRRAPGRDGQPFVAGERFLGCFTLRPWLGSGALVRWLEETFLSDYAEVVEAGERTASYRYLAGTPVAGSSSYRVEPLGPRRSRLTVVFEHQEVSGLAVSVLHRFALRQHDLAVLAQGREVARRLGVPVLRTTIP